MRADVRRPSSTRLAILACGLALAAAACSTIPAGEVEVPQGKRFIPTIPDSVDDVGLGESITLDDQGLPFLSYLGFPATLSAGEIPITRPVGSPFLTTDDGEKASAVLLAHLTSDQIWDKGAAAMPREAPSGFGIPFGPAFVPELASMTPHNAKGTDLALNGSDIHVVWGSETGVWYGLGPDFAIEAVEKTPSAGRPSIVLDDSGVPIVAYVVAGTKPSVRVAERAGKKWQTTTVATLSACGTGCPEAAQIAIVGGEPLVVVADAKSGDLIAASRSGSSWQEEVVAKGVTGEPSLAASGDAATIAFYTGTGVSAATGSFGNWSVQDVGEVQPAPSPSPGEMGAGGAALEPTTGVAVDGQGTAWVAWQSGGQIRLASSESGGDFKEVELSETDGGVTPSVAVTDDGSTVYLAWYDATDADLRLGFYGEVSPDLLLAAPSPTPAVETAGPPVACGKDKKPVLTIVAKNIAFDPTCLVADAGKPFTVTFENQDAGVQHNFEILTEPGSTDTIAATEPKIGTYTDELNVDALDAGTYPFQCIVHPTQMFGNLAVVAAGK